LYPFILFSSTIDGSYPVEVLQKEFIQNVLVENVYKRYYKTYLNGLCGEIDEECFQKNISVIKTWETAAQNEYMKNKISERIANLGLKQEKFEQNILEVNGEYWKKVKLKLHDAVIQKNIQTTQYITLIDLSKQNILIALYDSELKDFCLVGIDKISSGNINREKDIKFGEDHYFKTPTGIFKSHGGWRSDGRNNGDGFTKGYGHKNRYVFYFGEQKSIRYNTFDKNGTKILNKKQWKLILDKMQLAMHAHESSMQVGKAFSHGCLRTTHELNLFLDNNLILHKNYLVFNDEIKQWKWNQKYAAAPNSPKNYNFAGEYLVIVDKI